MVVDIAGRKIGVGHPCFIIAEAGVNHNKSLEMARQLVDVAVQAGADAVKFQTYKAENVNSPLAPKAAYQMQTTDAGESQLEMARQLELPFEAFRELADYSQSRGILFLSTPFDAESADFLADLGVAALKIPSGEITNLPFVAHIAQKGRPVIVSTGMSNLGEVDTAVRTIREAGNPDLVLMHCVSNYPADPADINLHAMRTMAVAFGVPVGYSDHTLGTEVALAAAALGACVIEKHFTLDCSLPGPDHRASLEPDDLVALVQSIRTVESALGHGRKEPAASEADTAEVARRSLVASRDIPAGTVLAGDMIVILRPGTGFPPAMLRYLVGRTVRVDVSAGEIFIPEMLV